MKAGTATILAGTATVPSVSRMPPRIGWRGNGICFYLFLVKVRDYGLLAPGNRKRLTQAKRLIGVPADVHDEPQTTTLERATEAKVIACPRCGQPMVAVQRIRPQARCPP